ncbi:hypothetical protein BDK51DRAFT_28609 [Blyttiomyces helicus]|uniref:Uncharacterized protein n=1 Tax=Blyttiomyces helicus TaxID=388810 RepID=A0A4V1IS30_9FUNG|nr:hypothetical protein BDK51DRAFT_28609 [Blyttiomyces helicus]|eukprot:RKO92127.1 hypothetical protein BDK51DRAFT_28609 [Blyttiomyces helicus]
MCDTSPARQLFTPLTFSADAGGPISSPPRRIHPHLPPELLDNIFNNLPNTQTNGSITSTLRSAATFCRTWSPVASTRIWTHPTFRSVGTLHKFTNCTRAITSRLDGSGGPPSCVRIFEIHIEDWRNFDIEGFTFRWSHVHSGMPITVVGAFLARCPHLVVLDTSAPRWTDWDWQFASDRRWWYGEWTPDDVGAGIGRLRSLRLSVRSISVCGEFFNLLTQSVGALLVEFSLEGVPILPRYGWGIEADGSTRTPRLEDALPSLEVLEIDMANLGVHLPSLVMIRPSLRRAVLTGDGADLSTYLPALLAACPIINHLELYTKTTSPHAALAALYSHPPLKTEISPLTLMNLLHARGSNLKIFDIDYNTYPITHPLLACIGQSAPKLEALGLADLFKFRVTPPKDVSLARIAFIAELKRACPKLRHVCLNVVSSLSQPSRLKREVRGFFGGVGG